MISTIFKASKGKRKFKGGETVSIITFALCQHTNDTSEGLYLWGYIYIERMFYLTQLNMIQLIFGIYIPIGCTVPYVYYGFFEHILVSTPILTCSQLSIYIRDAVHDIFPGFGEFRIFKEACANKGSTRHRQSDRT